MFSFLDLWVTFLAETSRDLEIILITIVLRLTNSVSRNRLYFSRETNFVYSNLFSMAKTVTIVVTFKQANAYAHPHMRATRRAQPLKITIHQLLHYCCLRQCYRVPFRPVIYRSFSSDFDGFIYLAKHSVSVVNPSHIHYIVWDCPLP